VSDQDLPKIDLPIRGRLYYDKETRTIKSSGGEAVTELTGTDLLIHRLNEVISRLELEKQALRKLIEDLVRQYAYQADSPAGFMTGGMSVLEEAFETLGWQDPHLTPELECDEPDCHRMATCGFPVEGGPYRRTCGRHFHPKEE